MPSVSLSTGLHPCYAAEGASRLDVSHSPTRADRKSHQVMFHLGQRHRVEKEELLLNTQADIKHCKELQDRSCNQSPISSDRGYSLLSLLTVRSSKPLITEPKIRFESVTFCVCYPFFDLTPLGSAHGQIRCLFMMHSCCVCVCGCLLVRASLVSLTFRLQPHLTSLLISFPNLSRLI